jgi:hypothetical protein
VCLDRRIADDPALTSMNDARLGAFAAPYFAGYKPHAAGAAVAGATVMGQLDAVAQSSIEQQLAAEGQKAVTVDGYLVISCHFPLQGRIGAKHGRYYDDNLAKTVRQSGKRVVALSLQMIMRQKPEKLFRSTKFQGASYSISDFFSAHLSIRLRDDVRDPGRKRFRHCFAKARTYDGPFSPQ